MGSDDENKSKTVNIHSVSKTTSADRTASSKDKKTSSSKRGLKLPVMRRLHLKPHHIVVACIILILGLFFTRVAIWEHNYLSAMEGSERDNPNPAASENETETDDTEPTTIEVQEYIVAADKPRYFTIRSLGIYNSRVVEVGLTNGDEMGTPRNIYDVGWYINSALPGANGVSIINAHGGDLGNGIFRNLPKISIGAEILVEMGDGRKYTYVVHDVSTQEIGSAANDYMPTAFSSPKAGVASMTLITCTGDWLEMQQTYSQRLFVRALLK